MKIDIFHNVDDSKTDHAKAGEGGDVKNWESGIYIYTPPRVK